MVSPLVFELALKIDDASMAGGWRIAAAYGTPNPEETALSEDGALMKVGLASYWWLVLHCCHHYMFMDASVKARQ